MRSLLLTAGIGAALLIACTGGGRDEQQEELEALRQQVEELQSRVAATATPSPSARETLAPSPVASPPPTATPEPTPTPTPAAEPTPRATATAAPAPTRTPAAPPPPAPPPPTATPGTAAGPPPAADPPSMPPPPAPTPAPEPPSVSYPEPGSPEGLSVEGFTTPFSADLARLTEHLVGPSQNVGETDPLLVVTHLRLCRLSAAGRELCTLEPPPKRGSAGTDYFLPVPPHGGKVRVAGQLCNEAGCGVRLSFGTITRWGQTSGDFYAVTTAFRTAASVGVYVLDSDVGRVEVEYSNGFSWSASCSLVGRCGSPQVDHTTADGVTISTYAIDGTLLAEMTVRLRF